MYLSGSYTLTAGKCTLLRVAESIAGRDGAMFADMDAAELEATAAALVAAILDAFALATGHPFHEFILLKKEENLSAKPV